jgi:hypothetical protein
VPIRDGRALLNQFGPGLGVALRPEFLNRSGITRRISEK